MLETALDDSDASPIAGCVGEAPDLQPLSPREQRSLYLSEHPQGHCLESSQGGHQGSQGLAGDALSGSSMALDLQLPCQYGDRHQHQGSSVASLADDSGEDRAMSRNLSTAAAVVENVEGVGLQDERTLRQYGRSLSAMRGRQSRPGLASVRFAEDPHDTSEDQHETR